MNILEIVSGAAVNGAVVHASLLARELSRRGHRVTLACRPGSWIAARAARDGIEVAASDLHRWPPGELRRFAALVKEKGIDVVHTHMSRAHFFGVLLGRMTGVTCVATAHSRHVQPHFAFNDRVIAVSEATARFHRRWNLVRPSRLDVIANFVDAEAFGRAPQGTRDRLRSEWGIGPHDVALGAVGSLIAEKGLDHVVGAFGIVRAAVPHAHARLVLVGDGPDVYIARLRAQAVRLDADGAISWAGHREDIPDVLSALDIFVLASLGEALPMALLEAMAAGLPVVATAVGGVPEIVGQDDNGLLVPPRDLPALASALISLAEDAGRRRRLGMAGRHRALERFSAATQVPLIEAVLRGQVC